MKYFVVAGEASGDLHASNLAEGIRLHDKEAVFEAWGGDLMANKGITIHKHIRELAFMGFTEVLANIRTIFRNIALVKEQIVQFSPDALILVDYPGFNMRIAKWAHQQDIKVYYYISPNVWAWKSGRVHHFEKYCEKLFVILPFEKDFYKKFNIDVEYEGHPLIDAIEGFRENKSSIVNIEQTDNRPVIALLAGSRKQEIKRMLPIMLKLPDYFPDYRFIVAGAPAIDQSYYDSFLKGSKVGLVMNQTYALLSQATAGVIVSGTATLETAIFGIPQVVGYRAGLISALIAGAVMKVKYISLPNLILNKKAVTELLQYKFNEKRLVEELQRILPQKPAREEMLADYAKLHQMLGQRGASMRVGEKIVVMLKNEV